jgi:hypothetical protein
MDDDESVELDDEGVDDFDIGDPGEVTVTIRFKSGHTEVMNFRVPIWTPIYGEPIDGETIYRVIASAYSMGESPFLALPTDNGSYKFFDLSATDFVEVAMRYDDDKS